MFLNFLKTVGTKLFGKSEPKPEPESMGADVANGMMAGALHKLLMSMNLDATDVSISCDGDTVTVEGTAGDQATKEKVTLTLGNVEGIAAVTNNMTVNEEADESRFYEVQKGDSLWKISQEMYGNGAHFQFIVDANQPMIVNADLIYPGQQLRIPVIEVAA